VLEPVQQSVTRKCSEEHMKNLLVRFVREEEGQDLVEYAFLIVFIALVAVVGANQLGIDLREFYNGIGTAVSSVTTPAIPTPGS
jgi:Flp pilus assembly pilin Flp